MGMTLSTGQGLLDTFHEEIANHRNTPGHIFYRCELKNEHSKLGNKHETDKHFTSGVIKIQNKLYGSLTVCEKSACKIILKKNHPQWQEESNVTLLKGNESTNDDDKEVTLASLCQAVPKYGMDDVLNRKLKEEEEEEERNAESEYVNCNHILASAAVCEILWSKKDAMVPQRRAGLSPSMVDALLFLKENREFWGIREVAEGLRMVKHNEKTARTKKKMQSHMEEEAIILEQANAFGISDKLLPVDYNFL